MVQHWLRLFRGLSYDEKLTFFYGGLLIIIVVLIIVGLL